MRDDETLLRQYLTGELGEDDAEALERRLLVEDDLFEACEALDDDLAADCVRGELPANQRAYVLGRLSASPSGRARLALAKTLTDIADGRTRTAAPPLAPSRARSRRTTAWRWATLAAALLAVLLAAVWLSSRRDDLEAPPRQAESPAPTPLEAPSRQTPAPSPAPPHPPDRLAHRPPDAKRPPPLVFQLSLVVRRSAVETPRLTLALPAEAGRPVEIRIDLDESEGFTAYWSLLRDGASGALRREDRLAVRPTDWGSLLVLELAASDLPPGGYELEVLGDVSGQPERVSLGRLTFDVVSSPAPT
jgi:hypothetical protein